MRNDLMLTLRQFLLLLVFTPVLFLTSGCSPNSRGTGDPDIAESEEMLEPGAEVEGTDSDGSATP